MKMPGLMRRMAVMAALALPSALGAQSQRKGAAAPARSDTTRIDTTKSVHICIDCGGFGRAVAPIAYLITDSAGKPLVVVGPTDSVAAVGLGPEDIGQIRVVKPNQPITDAGTSFRNGVVVIALSPRGTANWASRHGAPSDSTRPNGRSTPH